jgi:hypothetical protein
MSKLPKLRLRMTRQGVLTFLAILTEGFRKKPGAQERGRTEHGRGLPKLSKLSKRRSTTRPTGVLAVLTFLTEGVRP